MGCVSHPVQPHNSVLPGCIYAVAFTKVYLYRPMGSFVEAHPGPRVQHSLYIDDSGQYTSSGSPQEVGRRLALVAGDFVDMMEGLGLEVSLGKEGKSIFMQPPAGCTNRAQAPCI